LEQLCKQNESEVANREWESVDAGLAMGQLGLPSLQCRVLSGASMNPVRSLAPDLVRGDLSTTWVYVVGPFVGALIRVAFEWILKGKPTAAGTIASQGTLDVEN
jgi:aquaporin Z